MLHKNKPQTHHLSTESSKETDFFFPSFEQVKGSEVFVSLKKPASFNQVKKQLSQENAFQSIKKQNSTHKNQRKTIERKIKQLLKGKQQLANYLESEKQFIQVLDVHDQQLRKMSQNRGKLASSLTQKKKSRIDTYTAAKKSISSNLSKASQGNVKIPISKNEALTMQVLKKQGHSHKSDSREVLKKRQYETVSFNELYSQENQQNQDQVKENLGKQQQQKKQQKYKNNYKISSKQNYLPGQQCFVMTSPKKKPLKLSQKSNYEHNSFYATKYGLSHFSPWAFPKNQYEAELSEHSSVIEDKKINERKVFHEKLMNFEEKKYINQAKFIVKKGQSGRKHNSTKIVGNLQKQAFKDTISNDSKEKENIEKQTVQSGSQKKQNYSIQHRYLSLQAKKDQTIKLNGESNAKVVKSSQVIILQSQTLTSPEIFASKQQAKQMFYPRKSLKFQSGQTKGNSTSIEAKVFPTQVNLEERERENTFPKSTQQSNFTQQKCMNEMIKLSQLGELKKTEQFLKEIILTKNSVSYSNSRSISKKEFKKINQSLYEQKSSKRSNVFMTKNLLQPYKFTEKSPQRKLPLPLFGQDNLKSIEKNLDRNQSKQGNERHIHEESDCFSADKQNSKTIQSDTRKKAKTSLDNPLSEKGINEFVQKSNTKCLTEASLNGFYLINESKIRNTRNSFVRRKRHSMMVKKKASEDRKSSEQSNQRRLSYSTDKQFPSGGIYDMSLLEQSKGFGIVNPLTKQLYKKYVSIVQNKR